MFQCLCDCGINVSYHHPFLLIIVLDYLCSGEPANLFLFMAKYICVVFIAASLVLYLKSFRIKDFLDFDFIKFCYFLQVHINSHLFGFEIVLYVFWIQSFQMENQLLLLLFFWSNLPLFLLISLRFFSPKSLISISFSIMSLDMVFFVFIQLGVCWTYCICGLFLFY